MENYDELEYMDTGVRADLYIVELARLVAYVFGYAEQVVLDVSKPNGTLSKVSDTSYILPFI